MVVFPLVLREGRQTMFKRLIKWLKKAVSAVEDEDDEELLLQFLIFDEMDGD
ncbi:hypothetical protein ES703_02140 [subsurface metagenome]